MQPEPPATPLPTHEFGNLGVIHLISTLIGCDFILDSAAKRYHSTDLCNQVSLTYVQLSCDLFQGLSNLVEYFEPRFPTVSHTLSLKA